MQRKRDLRSLFSFSPFSSCFGRRESLFGGNIVVKEVLHPFRNFSVVCKPDLTKRRLPSVLTFLPALSCCDITRDLLSFLFLLKETGNVNLWDQRAGCIFPLFLTPITAPILTKFVTNVEPLQATSTPNA